MRPGTGARALAPAAALPEYTMYLNPNYPMNLIPLTKTNPSQEYERSLARKNHTSDDTLYMYGVIAIGELDRPSRVYSDRKYIFCEYLRPFAARGEHAVARARVRRKSKDIYGEPSL